MIQNCLETKKCTLDGLKKNIDFRQNFDFDKTSMDRLRT